MASGSQYRCARCNRTFAKMKAADAVRALFSFLFVMILVAAFIEFVEGAPLIPGVTFASINVIISAVVVLILVHAAAAQTVKQERKKLHAEGGMYCLSCQGAVKAEAEQARQVQAAETAKWSDEVKAMANSDPVMRPVLQEWKLAHGEAEPTKAQMADLRKAVNLEKAGNFEGAAKIFEDHKLWHLAGKAREKDRVQTVKHVTVDMNQLIEQIGSRGLAVPYKCHNCGAGITIDKSSSVSGLKFCSYCGSAYNIEDMSKIVQEALNY